MKSAFLPTRLVPARAGMAQAAIVKLMTMLFIGSLLLHVGVVVLFIEQPIALDDMFQYDMLARSLKAGNGFRWYTQADIEILRPYYAQFLDLDRLVFPTEGLLTTFRAPGYPFFLAFLYLFTPVAGRFILARLVQASMVALLAPMSALLGYQIGFSRKVCALAGLGLGLYPILLFYPIGLVSENLYILLSLVSVNLILLSARRTSWGWAALAGLACGLTMFARSVFAVAVLLGGVWVGLSHPQRKKSGCVFLLIAFGFCLPWSIRNSLIMRRPAFVENSAGYNLFIGYHPEGDGGFVSRIAILPMAILDDGERDHYCLQQALYFIRQNPLEAARRVGVRLVKFFGPEDREFTYFYSNDYLGVIPQPWISLVYALLIIPWGMTLFLGTFGLWRQRRHPFTCGVVLFLAGYALPHFFIIAEPRFHLAWVSILMPFAAYGWDVVRKVHYDPIWKESHLGLILLLVFVAVAFATGLAMSYPRLIALLGEGGNQLRFSY